MASAARLLPVCRRVAYSQSQITRTTTRRAFSSRPTCFVKKYTSDHEWVELDDGGKIATIGITEYAANALGDVVYAELPGEDLEVKKGDAIGAVESVKSASDIYAPLSGKVVENNKILEEKPGTINKSPEGDGWLAKMEVENATELDELLTKEDYDALEK